MKKTNFYLNLIVILFALVVLSSCKKDDDDDVKNDYYGKWQSKVYPSLTTAGAVEKMVFDFTNTTFEDKVYQGISADALQPAAGIKGDIVYNAPSTLNAEINEVSVQGSPYINKSVDATSFATYFGATLGKILDEQFIATYEFVGDTMIFNLPVKGSDQKITLKLGKVAE